MHKSHNLCTKEEYLKGYKLSLSKKCENGGTFEHNLVNTHSERPMILEIIHYGCLPTIEELVLRGQGYKFRLK